MKKIISLGVICAVLFGVDAISATRPTRPTAGAAQQKTTQSVAAKSASAQTGARAAVRKNAPGVGVTATKNTAGTNAQAKNVPTQSGGSVNTVVPKASGGVSARAATTQKAINTGVKIAGATTNTVVSEECKTKYYGCMDSFCMLDNTNGGRCLCSDKNAELDNVLAQIQKLDEQSYALATTGVERINMGEDADAVMSMVDSLTKSMTAEDKAAAGVGTTPAKKKARTLDLSAWDNAGDSDDDDVFGESEKQAVAVDLSNKTGDELHNAVMGVCGQQIPECAKDMAMLKMMYMQQIKSDCSAYENSLKKQRSDSAKKLQTAQAALREAALEQHQNANKYDLGQCTVRFKECMQTTAGCGSDFSKCASVVAADNIMNSSKVAAEENSKTRKSTKTRNSTAKNYTIKTGITSITIAASTYDMLTSKKPMCETVLKQCVNVKDKVWETFIKESAPELKSAELIAESNLRTNCISDISACFQKACKDNMDPNDPEGSYDMCLSRPQTMRSLCKIQIDPCEAAEPQVLDYVYARLASMRVDACTKEVKACLQNTDRCGEDYSQCIGLDTDTIITKMCPVEKLTACNTDENGNAIKGESRQAEVYSKIENIISGIMLNIDNSLLTQCQNALNDAMVKVCGGTEDCNNLVIDSDIGTRSLDYKICEYDDNGSPLKNQCLMDVAQITDDMLKDEKTNIAGFIMGTVFWEDVTIDDSGNLVLGQNAKWTDESKTEVTKLQTNISNAIKSIEADPKVQFCMTGRDVQGIGGKMLSDKNASQARFPELTQQTHMIIANSALQIAKNNYYKKYDEYNDKMLKDYTMISERMTKLADDAKKAELLERKRKACVNFAEVSMLPKARSDVAGSIRNILLGTGFFGLPFTAAGIVSTATMTAKVGDLQDKDLLGHKEYNAWNYRETINTQFNMDTGVCKRCTISRSCKSKYWFKKECKTWNDQKESCVENQF